MEVEGGNGGNIKALGRERVMGREGVGDREYRGGEGKK